MTRVGILTALAVLIGVVGALVWANVAVLPAYVVQADGHATISENDLSQVFSGTFTYAVIGFVGGLAIGIAVWAQLRRLGWPVAPITAGLALLGGGTCWVLGELVGPGPFADRMAAAVPGESVPIALQLAAPSALAIWVFAAVAVPLFAASLGPEVGGLTRDDSTEPAAEDDAAVAEHPVRGHA